MPIGDPASAPPRADLGFLRRRARPAAPAAPAARPIDVSHHTAAGTNAAPPGSVGANGAARTAAPIDYTHHSSAKPAESAAPPPARPHIDFNRPGRTPVAPPRAPAPASAPSSASSSLDLSGSGSLDLSGASASAARQPEVPPLPRFRGPRIAAGQQLLLGPDAPAVTLTRLQSGIGRLTVQAVCSPEVGDLRLGALYQLRSGGSSTVQLAGGNRFAPSSRRPVIVAAREEYEQLGIDLRQVRDVERLTVYAFSESRVPLTWGGTLVVTTFGGGRVEVPLETLAPAAVAVVVSVLNLDGELVVRSEMESVAGDIREAARAYGYDRITWRDERTPID